MSPTERLSRGRTAMPGMAGKHVVVTGGTRGLGRAIGMAFAEVGCDVALTHRWGSTPDAEVYAAFEARDLKAPTIVKSNVGDREDVAQLMGVLARRWGRLDVIVNNVSFAKTVRSLDDLKANTLDLSIRYSAWPLASLVQEAFSAFGTYPRHVVAISSDGSVICHPGYDLAGASKAVLETLCRYLALRLWPAGVRVNALRPGMFDSDSFRATFGAGASAAVAAAAVQAPQLLVSADDVAGACVALCSGWMDAITGQVITVDQGASLLSPLSLLHPNQYVEPEGGDTEGSVNRSKHDDTQ